MSMFKYNMVWLFWPHLDFYLINKNRLTLCNMATFKGLQLLLVHTSPWEDVHTTKTQTFTYILLIKLATNPSPWTHNKVQRSNPVSQITQTGENVGSSWLINDRSTTWVTANPNNNKSGHIENQRDSSSKSIHPKYVFPCSVFYLSRLFQHKFRRF